MHNGLFFKTKKIDVKVFIATLHQESMLTIH
jgi:hypothetical protein